VGAWDDDSSCQAMSGVGRGGEGGRRGRRRKVARPPCCRWALDHVLAARRRRIGGASRRRIDVVMAAMAPVSASVARTYRVLRRVQVSRRLRAYVRAPRRGRACACDVTPVGGCARRSDTGTVQSFSIAVTSVPSSECRSTGFYGAIKADSGLPSSATYANRMPRRQNTIATKGAQQWRKTERWSMLPHNKRSERHCP